MKIEEIFERAKMNPHGLEAAGNIPGAFLFGNQHPGNHPFRRKLKLELHRQWKNSADGPSALIFSA